jgi:hypothetical protein
MKSQHFSHIKKTVGEEEYKKLRNIVLQQPLNIAIPGNKISTHRLLNILKDHQASKVINSWNVDFIVM